MDTKQSSAPLRGQRVIVTGATGHVGEGIARGVLAAGATVIAVGRSAERLAALRGYLADADAERLITAAGDTSSFMGFPAFVSELAARHGGFDHAVASASTGWWQGKPIWEVGEAEFDAYLVGTLKLHLAATRAFVPHLKNGGSYTLVAGLSAILPLPGVSLMGIMGGAQLMLANALQADAGERLRVNTAMLGFVISRGRPTGRPDWITADDVGAAIAAIASSEVRGQVLRMDDRPTLARTLAGLGR